jgi:hypothetical protein
MDENAWTASSWEAMISCPDIFNSALFLQIAVVGLRALASVIGKDHREACIYIHEVQTEFPVIADPRRLFEEIGRLITKRKGVQ